MSSWLGPALLAITKGRSAQLAGQQQTQANEDAVKMKQLQLAIQAAQRKQQAAAQEASQQRLQATLDETMRHNQAVEAAAANKQPATPAPHTLETSEGYVILGPDGVPKPLQMGGKTLQPKPQKWQVPGAGGGESGGSWSVQQTDEGMVQVNSKTGEVRPVMQGGSQVQKPLDASTKMKVATNKQTESSITKALGSLVNNRQAVGLANGRGLSDMIDSRRDPNGVETRALIANIGSMIFHDRSGAAVSVSEAKRLKPFIPSIQDNAETIVQKLRSLREAIETETGFLTGRPASSSTSPALIPNDKPLSAAEILAKHGIHD